MSKIRRIVKDGPPRINAPEATAAIEISHTRCGHDFSFELHGNHLRPFPTSVALNGIETPWYEALTEGEQQLLFQEALSEYRLRSRGQGGWKIAALGVTVDGDIFVSENTETLASDFYRQCAEQNMVTIATQREAYYDYTERLADEQNHVEMGEAKPPRFRSVTLMGGPKPGDRVCPCGNCTELLDPLMIEGGSIYIAPVALPRKLDEATGMREPRIATQAANLKMIPPGITWKVSSKHLNADRFLPMKQPQLSQDAYAAMCQRIADRLNAEYADAYIEYALGRPSNEIEPKLLPMLPTLAFPEKDVNDFLQYKVERVLLNRVRDLTQSGAVAFGRRLMAEFDDMPDTQETFERMREAIDKADPPYHLTGDYVRELIAREIKSIRAVAVQTQRGNFHYALESKSHPKASKKLDPAMPCAEITVLGSAVEDSMQDGIRNVRAVELNPEHIAEGKMETSPKDGVERLAKRRGRDGQSLTFGYYPLNDRNLTEKGLLHIMETRSLEELFPGYFTGRAGKHTERLSTAADVPQASPAK